MHHVDRHIVAQRPLDHADVGDGAAVGIVIRVKYQRLQRCFGVSLRRWNALNDGFEDLLDPFACLRRAEDRVGCIQPDDLLDLILDNVWLGARQIDLVDHRNDLEIVLQRQIHIRQRLRFNALGRVHDQKRPFAGCQRARNLVGKVDVPRRVDEIENVFLSVLRFIIDAHSLQLDRDAALALDVHIIKEL